jgi:hypothetical protein
LVPDLVEALEHVLVLVLVHWLVTVLEVKLVHVKALGLVHWLDCGTEEVMGKEKVVETLHRVMGQVTAVL